MSHNFDSVGIAEDLAKELLSLHWKATDSTFLSVYMPAFMRDSTCDGP